MVDVAQLVERQIVALDVVGSIPIVHPICKHQKVFFRRLFALTVNALKIELALK